MRKRQVQIPILCEDDEHESFILSYLSERGYQRGKLRVLPYPADGKGSGKDFVRTQYVSEVRAARRYRRMHRSETYALVVLIDQDKDSQPEPYSEFDQRLRNAGLDSRAEDEPIAIFAPKRCIETWAYHLLDPGRAVDELEDYSKRSFGIRHADLRRSGSIFSAYAPSGDCPLPSLVIGCGERRRIP